MSEIRDDSGLSEESRRAIQRELDAAANALERRRLICGRIGATTSARTRRELAAWRDEIDNARLAEAGDHVRQAVSRSAEEGWTIWVREVAEATSLGDYTHAARLCETPLGLDAGRNPSAPQLRQMLEYILQARWAEIHEQLTLLSRLECLPARTRAYFITVVALVGLYWFGGVTSTQRLFDEALGLAADDAAVQANLGHFWLHRRDLKQAAACYQRAIELAPRWADGYCGMGERFEADNRFDDAEAWFRRAIDCAGGESIGYERLLRVLGRPRVLLERESEFLALVDTILAVAPENAHNLYLDVGRYYLDNTREAEAKTWYDKAVALEPTWPGGYTALALLARHQHNDMEAERYSRMAIEVAPESFQGYQELADLFEERQRWEAALRVYQSFPKRPPQMAAQAWTSALRMRAKLGSIEEAERVLREALPRAKEEAHVWRALESIAIDYYRDGKVDGAKRIFDDILNTVNEEYRDLYYNRLGKMYYYLGDYSAAAAAYQNAIAKSKPYPIDYRNLSLAYEALNDYDKAERALENAYGIDKDEVELCQGRARLANQQGNDALGRSEPDKAVQWFAKAVELDDSKDMYHSNLARAYEQVKTPGKRLAALENAMRAYEQAQRKAKSGSYADRITRLGRRIQVAKVCGERMLDFMNAVTPIAVEVAADLIPMVEGKSSGVLSDELLAEVIAMRDGVRDGFGVNVPGIRFRGNETDLAAGTYIVMINEIPLVSGTVLPGHRFCIGSDEDWSALGIRGHAGVDPQSRRDGIWLGDEDLAKAQSTGICSYDAAQYLMRHVERVLRLNLVEFFGHQEVFDRLSQESTRAAEEIRASPRLVTTTTAVCRALLAEEVPVQPFGDICEAIVEHHALGSPLREVVEHIRMRPAFCARLPGNSPEYAVLHGGGPLESAIRRGLYANRGHTLLAMEPEPCQAALTAIRDQATAQSLVLVVEDPVVRPFARKLVELEFPDMPVLSRAELNNDATRATHGSVQLEEEPSGETVDFANPEWVVAHAPAGETKVTAIDLPELDIVLYIAGDFATKLSPSDDSSMESMLGMMQEGLFYELGVLLPQVSVRTDLNLKSGQFRIRLNGVDLPALDGIGRDEFLVNDTPERLDLLGVKGRTAFNPANGSECAVVANTGRNLEACRDAGLTTWDARGYAVLQLSSEIRKAAAQFQTLTTTQYNLDSLAAAYPDLVGMALERYPLEKFSHVLRELLEEEISIRDLRSILESVLSVDGTTDVDLGRFIVFLAYTDNLCPAPGGVEPGELSAAQLADFVRVSLKRYISHKYTRGSNRLSVYLMEPRIEQRIVRANANPLTSDEQGKLWSAIDEEIRDAASWANAPVLLTSFEVRRALRRLIERHFPRLAVVSYQELSPDMNIYPIARISWL